MLSIVQWRFFVNGTDSAVESYDAISRLRMS